jgi:hypothetical protein
MRAYRLKRPNGSWTPPIDEQDFDRSVHRRAKLLEGPVRLRENGGKPGVLRSVPAGVDKLLRKAHEGDVGYHSSLLNAKHHGILTRVVEDEPQPANTSGSPGVDLVVGFMNEHFEWQSWGIYVYKHIAGSSTYSDHSYVNHNVRPEWCGRAIDIRPEPFTMALGDEVKAALLGEESIVANMRYLLWRVPDHYDHIHVSMDDIGAPGSC